MLRVADLVLAALLAVAAAIQLNDPDPWPWLAVYGAAAALSAIHAWRPLPRALPALLAAVAGIWALTLLPAAVGRVTPPDLVRAMEPDRPAIEIAREVGGLLLVAGWMAVLVAVPTPRRS